MSPLLCQNFDSPNDNWKTTARIRPGSGVYYLTDILDPNSIRVILFEVENDDSKSIVYVAQESFSVNDEVIISLVQNKKPFRGLEN